MRVTNRWNACHLLLAAFLVMLVAAPMRPALAEEKEDLAPMLRGALCKVQITRQSWDFTSPWKKHNPSTSRQRGVMVRSGLILTPAAGLRDHVMIEISVANSARRYPASLAHLDYAANLALVKIDDYDLKQKMEPIPVGEPITIDAELEIWQLGASDLLERFTGHVQKVAPVSQKLQVTVKTNCSDRGDGQVVIKDGKLVGLVTSTVSSRQEGRLLAVETIQHYLKDYDSGDYKGFGTGPIWYHKLLRDDFRAYYEVPEDVHGLVIAKVLPGRTGHGALQSGDVLAEVAGCALDDEGMFNHPLHGRLHVYYLLYGSTHPGDEVAAKIYRKGKAMDVKIPIRSWPFDEQRVPAGVYDQRPPYMVVGGMVILELTRRHRGSWAINEYQNRYAWDDPSDRKRIVFVNQVLDDKSNKGLDDVVYDAMLTVNNKKITCIQDVNEALKTPLDGYHIFTFEGINKPFVIKAADLDEIDKRIAKTYRVTELKYLGEDAKEDVKKDDKKDK
jgi:S1-C subfamily serine protease